MNINVLYEDQYLLVLDKPAGLVSTPAETIPGQRTLADITEEEFGVPLGRGGLVHRLDKDTSGVIIVAKDADTFEKLQAQFKERTVKKEYWALVHGDIVERGRIEGAIGRNPGDRQKFAVLEDGKEAATLYEPLKHLALSEAKIADLFPDYSKVQLKKLHSMSYPSFTLLKCNPETGRTHQIRVHLKYINHSIVSDDKYGGRKIVRLDKRWCQRMFLHAKRIQFIHPSSGDMMNIESPLPDDLEQALSNLVTK